MVDYRAVEREDIERDERQRRRPVACADASEHAVEVAGAALAGDQFAVEHDGDVNHVGELCKLLCCRSRFCAG